MSGLTDLTKVCGLPAQQAAGCYLVLELTDVQGRATAFRIAPSTGGRLGDWLRATRIELAQERGDEDWEATDLIERLPEGYTAHSGVAHLSEDLWDDPATDEIVSTSRPAP